MQSGRRRSASIFPLVLVAVLTCSPAPLRSQPAAQQPGANADNALALEIIAAWQNSSRAPNLKARIALIEKALTLAVPANPWPFRDPPRDDLLGQMWGQLGNEYRRIEGGERPEALERALKSYGQALRHIPRTKSADWARLQYGIGLAQIDRISGDRAENIEGAIAAFDSAAEIMTKASAPSHWGSLQIALSKAYWHRIKGVRADNLERAIAAAEAALSVLQADKTAGDWSAAQQALGAAYWGRIHGNRADNIEKAIAAYEQALTVLREDRHPEAWAGTHDNLGMAYAQRGRGERLANIQRSAAAFEQASRIFVRERYPSEWAQLNMNFGNLLLDDEIWRTHDSLERAIQRFENALTVYTPERYPERSARVQLNFGIALARRGSAADIERAIAAYGQAFKYYTPERDPMKWATGQTNLAAALRKRGDGDRAANLSAAAAAYDAALTVLTSQAFPRYNMGTAGAAGSLASARGEWTAAKSYFDRAIASAEALLGQGLDAHDARLVLEVGGRIFSDAAYAAMHRNAPVEAVDLLETGKARLLRVVLGLDALALPPATRAELDALRREIRDLDARVDLASGSERQDTIKALEVKRERIASIMRLSATPASGAGGEPGSSRGTGSQIAASLLSSFAAIAMPVVTENGGALLLVTQSAAGPSIEALPLPQLDFQALNRVLVGSPESNGTGGWGAAYAINRLPPDQQAARWDDWTSAIAGLAPQLANLWGSALDRALAARSLAAGRPVLIIPHGALGLFPMGLAQGGAAEPALIDKYVLTISPSLAAAEFSRDRANLASPHGKLAAIANPTGDLKFAEPESAVAASYFPGQTELLGKGTAGKSAVVAALSQASHWHFATHGAFDWTAPRRSALLLSNSERLSLGDLLDGAGGGAPRLVVLSACETGLLDFQRLPDEFTGLPAAFLQAGAAGVVASLWPVDDISTTLLMMRFYERLVGAKAGPAVALREAQLWLRDASKNDIVSFVGRLAAEKRITASHHVALSDEIAKASDTKPFSHPYHWAAFQHYGG